jgi:hypothetical protein
VTEAQPRFWRPFLVAWAIFAVLAATWSIATPIGASPDEPAHLIRASSVATGQIAPFIGNADKVRVPEWVWYAQRVDCFALGGNTTPTCVAPDAVPQTRQIVVYASAGRYNPLYYAAVGWPSVFFSTNAGIYAMRVVSGVLVSLFLALSFALILGWRRRLLPLLGLVIAATPMVLFLSGMVNPNSLEITATLAAFVGMLTIVREPAPELLGRRAAIVFVAAAVAANMRGLSLLWIAVALLAPLILITKDRLFDLLRTRSIRLLIVGCAVAFAAAAAWMVIANPLGAGDPGATGTLAPQGLGTSHVLGFLWTLFSTFFYGQQMVGQFGWLETPAPASVYFLWSGLIGGIILTAFVVLRRRALLLTAALVGALLLLPPLIQGIYVTSGGVIWQGRYILPVFVCTVVGVAAVLSDRVALSERTSRRAFALVIGAIAIAQFLAFATTLKRYAVGMKPEWPAMLHPTWSPPGGVVLVLAVFGVALLFGAVLLVLHNRQGPRAESHEGEQVDDESRGGASQKSQLDASH